MTIRFYIPTPLHARPGESPETVTPDMPAVLALNTPRKRSHGQRTVYGYDYQGRRALFVYIPQAKARDMLGTDGYRALCDAASNAPAYVMVATDGREFRSTDSEYPFAGSYREHVPTSDGEAIPVEAATTPCDNCGSYRRATLDGIARCSDCEYARPSNEQPDHAETDSGIVAMPDGNAPCGNCDSHKRAEWDGVLHCAECEFVRPASEQSAVYHAFESLGATKRINAIKAMRAETGKSLRDCYRALYSSSDAQALYVA